VAACRTLAARPVAPGGGGRDAKGAAIATRGANPSPPFLGAFGRRLFAALALLSVLLAGAVGVLGYVQARRALRAEAMTRLENLARERRARLESWFEERLGDVRHLASLLELELARAEPDPRAMQSLLALELRRQPSYRRFAVVDSAGAVLALAGRVLDEGCRRPFGPAVGPALERGETVLGPFERRPGCEPVMRLAAPLRRDREIVAAVLAVMHPAETIHPILADTTGLGRTGETYLVGPDTTMLTPSRHMDHPPALTHKMPTPGVLACLAGKSGGGVYPSYMGPEVLGAWEWMPRQRWALMAEICTEEAFAPLGAMARDGAILGAAALLLALLVSVLLSRRLAGPVGALAAASRRVAAGDLSPPALPGGPGELGVLSARFGEMVAALDASRRDLERSGRELARAEKLAEVGRLAAGLVHEMRNPLAALEMNLSSLARSGALTDVEREQLAIAREQGARLERMLGELLEYSRPVAPRFADLDAAALAARVSDLSRAELERRGVRLELDVPDPPFSLTADAEILARALVNLVHNAAQASPPGAAVRLKLRRSGDVALVKVADAGAGMPAATRARLFEPFFTTREDGTGLGLSNARKYVEAHGGRITIETEAGRGTTARVIMPADLAPAAPPGDTPAGLPPVDAAPPAGEDADA